MHHIPSQEQGHLPRGRGSGRGPSGSGSGSSGSGDTGGRLTRWRDYQLRRATTSPLLPNATSLGPNTGTAQPQLTRHAPPHTCRYWGSRMDPDCVFSCLLRAALSLAYATHLLPSMQGFRLRGLLTGLLPLVAFCILKQ